MWLRVHMRSLGSVLGLEATCTVVLQVASTMYSRKRKMCLRLVWVLGQVAMQFGDWPVDITKWN